MQTSELYNLYLVTSGISTDTRKIERDTLFFALRGPNFNGNEYAKEALDKGAAFAIVDDPVLSHDRFVHVDDVLQTLQDLSQHHREELGLPVIAVAGSNGKTTTKELTVRVLDFRYHAFATPGNLNNHIGVPLSLLQLTADDEIAVIELGANHRGETWDLCQIAKPDFGIVTNIGKDHLEGFKDEEGVELAYQELFDYLGQNKGKAFVNADDARLMRMAGDVDKILYGNYRENWESQLICAGGIVRKFPFIRVRMHLKEDQVDDFEIPTKLFGSFHLQNVLAATAIGLHFKVPWPSIQRAIEDYRPSHNRSEFIRSGSIEIILDAYNANPSSMEIAIADFGHFPSDKKVIILGDMHELGSFSKAEHRKIVQLLQASPIEQIILIGPEFGKVKGGLKCEHFDDVQAAVKWLKFQDFAGATFYIKGSRAQRLEQLVDYIASQKA